MLPLSMSNYDMDQLMGTYADWIAWLKEKEASLEGQLARMKGKTGEREAENEARAPVESTPTSSGVVPAEEVPEAAPVADDDSTPHSAPRSIGENSGGGDVPDTPKSGARCQAGETLPPGDAEEDDWL